MDDLHIITIVTKSDYYFPYLLESCERNGKKLTILGLNEKWKGFTWRFKIMINYLKQLKPTDIVCIIDGYDVICNRDLNELKNEFIKIKNKTNCKIVIGHDKLIKTNLYYINYLFVTMFYGKCKNISLNAGTYIGYVKDILDIILSLYTENDGLDDQQILTKYCNSNNDIYIDVNNKIFLTIDKPYSNIDNYLNIQNNTVIYNNNKPFFIHAPGNTYLEKTLLLLNYNVSNNNIQKSMIRRVINNLYIFIINNMLFILFILFIIIFIIYKLIKYYFSK